MIKVGCCGFGIARSNYYKKFDLVEIEQTFYQVPLPKTAARWRQEASRNFEFTLRAWQLITHPPDSPTYDRVRDPLPHRKLANYGWFQLTSEVLTAWDRTAEVARSLEARVIVFESPPGFIPEKTCIDNLTKFFGSIDRGGFTMVWEARSPWPRDLVASLCRDLDLTFACDPLLQPPLIPSLPYFRLHGRKNGEPSYADADLQALRRWTAPEGSGYVLFSNENMVTDAERFRKLLR